MNFKKVTLDSPIKSYFLENPARTCDCVWGTVQMWRTYFDISYAEYADCLILCLNHYDGKRAYLCPRGEHAEDALHELSVSDPHPCFCFVAELDLPLLRSVFPDSAVQEEPSWFDYLYDVAPFYDMSGKKYHGPKNHVNKFLRLYPDAHFTLSPDTNAIRNFIRRMETRNTRDDPMALAEYEILADMLSYREDYGMLWGALEVGGETVAVSAAEILGDTMYVHVEKADTEYPGAYQTVARAMAGVAAEKGISYLNREEDLGDPGLRRSKQSYNPVMLLKKYTVQA